jgi:hypothetical protein
LTAARRAATLAVIVVATVAIAGCGDSADKKFIDGYNKAAKPLNHLDAQLVTKLTRAPDQSDATVESAFSKLAERTHAANAKLADLDAPDDTKADFERLKAALKTRETHLRAVAAGIKSGDIKATQTAVSQLTLSARELQRAEAAVKKKVED